MSAKILDGKMIAEKIKEAIKRDIASLGARPTLASVQIGRNPSSLVYLNSQKKAALEVGIDYEAIGLPEDISQAEAAELAAKLSGDAKYTAVILQRPLPPAIDWRALIKIIGPGKDAEGVHPENLGRLLSGTGKVGPCTPMAVMAMLEASGQDLYGKEAVVIGHSDIVGKPLALMLLGKFATTTVCHIATAERGLVEGHVRAAEVVVAAVGKAAVVKGGWIKPGAIVIDVGINHAGGKIVGDVEFDEASGRASYITPVPGGVGPVTTAMLMRNVVELAR